MDTNRTSSRRWRIGAAAFALLLVFLALASRSRPAEVVEPEFVLSDSVADPQAVGMCAMSRATGAVEGNIVGLTGSEGEDFHQFRVRSRTNPGAEYVMDAAHVQVVNCDDTTSAVVPPNTPERSPL